MKRWILFWIFLIPFAWGQIVPQAGSMKLLVYDKKDKLITDALQIGNYTYFSVVAIDTVIGGVTDYPLRKSFIVKLDSSGQVVQTKEFTADSINGFYIRKLFPAKLSTGETVVGFVGSGYYLDYISPVNYWDSIGFLFAGVWDPLLDQTLISPKYFSCPPQSVGGYGPKYSVAPDDIIVHPVTDTSFLAYFTWVRGPWLWQKVLASFEVSPQGIFLSDSLTLFGSDSVPSLFKKGEEIALFSTTSGTRFLFQDTLKNLRVYNVSSLNPLSLVPFTVQSAVSYLPTGNENMLNLGTFSQGDTLWLYARLPGHGHIIWKFLASATVWNLLDSVTIAGNNLGGTQSFGAPLTGFSKHLFAVIPASSEFYFSHIQLYEWSWLHGFYGPNYFAVIGTDKNFQTRQILLGGDAWYEVRGIIAPTDSISISYGWRFPLGDTTRMDGDAFIWKITWDGLVTPILGKAPKYVFKIFPNPAKNILKISGKTKEATTFLLRSAKSKEILTQKFPARQEYWELDVSQIPRGIYLLEILTERGARFTEKVVLE